jgi:hypothetical protein
MSQQEGPTGTPGEVLGCASQRREAHQRHETHKCCPASSLSKPSLAPATVCPVLFIPSEHHVSSTVPASAQVLPQHVHLSQLTSLRQSAWVHWSDKKLQHTTRRFFFLYISLYRVPTNAAQLHHVRQTNPCVLLAKTPSSRVHSRACFCRTSSLLRLLQRNVPSEVCISLWHLCPLEWNTPVCPSKTPSDWLSEEPLSFHSRRIWGLPVSEGSRSIIVGTGCQTSWQRGAVAKALHLARKKRAGQEPEVWMTFQSPLLNDLHLQARPHFLKALQTKNGSTCRKHLHLKHNRHISPFSWPSKAWLWNLKRMEVGG